jgi:hypothetical protein
MCLLDLFSGSPKGPRASLPCLGNLDDQQLTFSPVELIRTSFSTNLRLYTLNFFPNTDDLEYQHGDIGSRKSERD